MAETASHFSEQNFSEQPTPHEFVDARIDTFDIDPALPFTPLRIGVVGMGTFADNYVKGAIAAGHEVVCVVGPAKQKDKELDVVRATARENGIPDFMFSSLNNPDTVEQLRNLKPDIMIAASVTAIIPDEVTGIAEMGMWGWHPSRPLEDGYRGRSAINWQRINELTDENGAPAIGMCVYALGREGDQIPTDKASQKSKPLPIGSVENDPNDIADQGPILAEKLVTLPENATTANAAFSKILTPEGVKFMIEITNKMAQAKEMGLIFRGQPQVSGEGNYQPPIEKEHVKIDWQKPAHSIKAMIDAATFNPGAWTMDTSGNMVTLYDGSVVEGQSQEPGRIAGLVEMEEGKGYVLIETGEDHLRVGTMRSGIMEGSREIKGKPAPAHQFANDNGLKKGHVFN